VVRVSTDPVGVKLGTQHGGTQKIDHTAKSIDPFRSAVSPSPKVMGSILKGRLPLTALAILSVAAPVAWSPRVLGQTRYTASWSSLDAHDPAPEWFQDAKFGVYYHWGAFATPMFGTEWYPRNMMNKSGNSAEYQHHMATYGDPYGDWGYDKFLTGANDKSGKFTQFAPKLKSAGGNWDPDEWAQMFYDAGARFAGPVAEHHDGFSMWDSKANEWNSVDKGPKLNLAKLHADAIRKKGLRLFMSLHHEWNFGGYWTYGTPTTSDKSLQKLYGKLPNAEEQTLWLDKLKEVIDEFLPDILHQDRYLSGISQTNLMTFLAYYYNAALDANKDVIAVAKETITDHKGQLYDYERGGPADIRTPYWMTDDSVGSQSWCYVSGLSYYTDAQFIGSFIDRVSKGGNMILNTSPMPDGTYPQRQKDILAAFGKFLRQNGTAIYNTRAWTVYGEGPTKMGGGEFTSPTALKATDIRYTKSKDGDALYALLGGWPGGQVNMTAVTTSRFSLGTGKVFLFGPTGGAAIELQATQDGSGLHVTLPSTQPYTAVAYAIKISKSGTVPAPTPWIDNPSNPDGGVTPTGGSSGSSDAGAPRSDGNAGAGGRGGTGGAAGASAGHDGASSAGGVGVGGSNTAGGSNTGGASGAGGSSLVGGANSSGGAGVTSSQAGGGTTRPTGGDAGKAGGAVSSGGNGISGSSSIAGGAGGHETAAFAGQSGSRSNSAASADSSSGCSCRTTGAGRANSASLILLGITLALLIRRRQR
jgi:alpha-L-fucosidase